jgi:transposase-like protein
MKKIYSNETKAEIIKKYLSGVKASDLVKEHGIARSTIYKWIKESSDCQKQVHKINMRDYFELKRRCQQQEKIIEILQNAPCAVNSSLQVRYDYIQSCSDKYSVNILCKAMKVAKGSYYNHIFRNKNEN